MARQLDVLEGLVKSVQTIPYPPLRFRRPHVVDRLFDDRFDQVVDRLVKKGIKFQKKYDIHPFVLVVYLRSELKGFWFVRKGKSLKRNYPFTHTHTCAPTHTHIRPHTFYCRPKCFRSSKNRNLSFTSSNNHRFLTCTQSCL